MFARDCTASGVNRVRVVTFSSFDITLLWSLNVSLIAAEALKEVQYCMDVY